MKFANYGPEVGGEVVVPEVLAVVDYLVVLSFLGVYQCWCCRVFRNFLRFFLMFPRNVGLSASFELAYVLSGRQ